MRNSAAPLSASRLACLVTLSRDFTTSWLTSPHGGSRPRAGGVVVAVAPSSTASAKVTLGFVRHEPRPNEAVTPLPVQRWRWNGVTIQL